MSQKSADPIQISVIKNIVESDPNSISTNVIKLENTSENSINVSIRVKVPNGWRTVKSELKSFKIASGMLKNIPIRVVSPKIIEGEKTYIIKLIISTGNKRTEINYNVFINSIIDFSIYPEQNTLYFSDTSNFESIRYFINNKSNIPLTIPIKTYSINNIKHVNSSDKRKFIRVGAFKTIKSEIPITFSRDNISSQKSTFKIEGEISGIVKYAKVDIYKNINIYNNKVVEISPNHNVELSVHNNTQDKKGGIRIVAHGNQQFTNNQKITYSLNAYDILDDEILTRNSVNIRYNYKKTNIGFGYPFMRFSRSTNGNKSAYISQNVTLIDNLENTSQISADTEYKVFNIGSKFDYKRKDFRTVLSANFNRDMRYKHHLSSASARQEITIAKGHKLNLYSDVTDRYVFSQDTTSELGFLYRLNYFGRIKNKINIGITSYYGDKKIYGYGRGEKYLKSLLGFKINNKHSISSETRFRDRDTDIKTANYTYKNKDREFVSDLLFNARLNNTLKLKSGLQIAGYEIKTIGNSSKNKSNLLNLKLESSLKFSNNHHMRFNMLAGIRETKIVNEFTDKYPNFFLELDHTFRGLFTRLIYEYGTNQLSSLYSSRNTERLNANVRFRQFLLDDKLKLEASAYSNYYFRNKQLSTTYLLESSYDLGSNFEPFIRGYYALYQNLSLKVITNDNYYIEAGIRKGISTHLKKYERSDLYITFFKDFNNNGIFDENDEPIPGISTSLSVKNLLHKNIDGKDNLNDNITGVTIYSSTDGEVVYTRYSNRKIPHQYHQHI